MEILDVKKLFEVSVIDGAEARDLRERCLNMAIHSGFSGEPSIEAAEQYYNFITGKVAPASEKGA